MRATLAGLAVSLCALAAPAVAQETPQALYLIFDASGSMWGQLTGGSHKISVAKEVLGDFVAGDLGQTELALRAYGHRRKGDCKDSELVVPWSDGSAVAAKVRAFMEEVNPVGKTPISYSLRAALEDFGDRSGEIILISDGIETCDEDPCELVRAWRGRDEVKIRVHVVGLGLDDASRQAMQCIAEAAGTEYHDASSAASLAEGLAKIQETTVPSTGGAFHLRGIDGDGETLRVRGSLSRSGSDSVAVSSNRRHLVAPGTWTLEAGVETRNGNLYRPIRREVTVAASGDTRVEVEVARPPSVRAKFLELGLEQSGALVHAFQDGREVFKFRSIDTVFLDEGSYEFRSQPNPENDLAVQATLEAGEHREIVFEMVQTVHVKIRMVASGSGAWFRQNYELWQDGEKKYGVHAHNGARVLPGTYEVHLPNKLTPYVEPGVVVTGEEKQEFEFTVPVGHVTVIYQRADGSRDDDKRSFISRGENGRHGTLKNSGVAHPLTPGTYSVKGWRGEYDTVTFEVREGVDQEVVLRAKE